jgi:hypothetical protein
MRLLVSLLAWVLQVRATLTGQSVALESSDVADLKVRLSDDMLDLDRPVVVTAKGVERWNAKAVRTIALLAKTLEERGDPRLVWSAEVAVSFWSTNRFDGPRETAQLRAGRGATREAHPAGRTGSAANSGREPAARRVESSRRTPAALPGQARATAQTLCVDAIPVGLGARFGEPHPLRDRKARLGSRGARIGALRGFHRPGCRDFSASPPFAVLALLQTGRRHGRHRS